MWFRRDLRLGDNPAWAAASRAADRVVGLYVLDPIPLASAGGFRRTQLLAHLHGLNECLGRQGGCLMVRTGNPAVVVPEVVTACGAGTVHANADVTPYSDVAAMRRSHDGLGDKTSCCGGATSCTHPNTVAHGQEADTTGLHTVLHAVESARHSRRRLAGGRSRGGRRRSAEKVSPRLESAPFQVGGEGAAD